MHTGTVSLVLPHFSFTSGKASKRKINFIASYLRFMTRYICISLQKKTSWKKAILLIRSGFSAEAAMVALAVNISCVINLPLWVAPMVGMVDVGHILS